MNPIPENNGAARYPGPIKLEVLKSCVVSAKRTVKEYNFLVCKRHGIYRPTKTSKIINRGLQRLLLFFLHLLYNRIVFVL